MTETSRRARPARHQKTRAQELYELATDSRNPALSRAHVDELFQEALRAMAAGEYQAAHMAVDALLCQADREDGARSPGLLPDPMATKIGEGRTGPHLEMIRGFIDRVESLNSRVQRGWRASA